MTDAPTAFPTAETTTLADPLREHVGNLAGAAEGGFTQKTLERVATALERLRCDE
jgi:hypothetical protein